jgi:thioredoxin-related protein
MGSATPTRAILKFALSTCLFLAAAGVAAAQNPPEASSILEQAETIAASQHKIVLLEFGASWCGPCHRLDDFTSDPQIAPILEKYFVFARVRIDEEHGQHPELNTLGSRELMARFGGFQGVPFIVFLDSHGNTIVTSDRPVNGKKLGENIGYPAQPWEIDWFRTMLKKGVPQMTVAELQTIQLWLQQAQAARK